MKVDIRITASQPQPNTCCGKVPAVQTGWGSYRVGCLRCDARGPTLAREVDAIAAWNRGERYDAG